MCIVLGFLKFYLFIYLFLAQCLKFISMVGLQVLTFQWKLTILKQVIIPVPKYWSQGDRKTQLLLPAPLQISWIPKIHFVELFSFFLFLFCYGHFDCDRSLARQKKKDNENSRKSGIQSEPSSSPNFIKK